jgi:osmotically inducible lipoprotein OsmB
MKKAILLAGAIVMALPLAACNNRDPGDRALGGAALGGAAGALIGAAATGRACGAIAGAAIGAAGGAIVGASTTPRRCIRSGYDYYGNPVCLRYAN